MASSYTIVQGDTLLRVAKQHGFARSSTIYEHPSNEEFRKLRPDVNIIYPGDIINIPDKEKLVQIRTSSSQHTFTLKKPEIDKFRIKVQSRLADVWVGKRAVLSIEGLEIDAPIGDDGIIQLDLPDGNETDGVLKVFMDADSDQPTHVYEMKIAHLDPVEELTGVQARCNSLGYDVGEINGEMNEQTHEAIKSFQGANGLEVNGNPDTVTIAKLKEKYGC